MRGEIALILSVLICKVTPIELGSGDFKEDNNLNDKVNCGNECVDDSDKERLVDDSNYDNTREITRDTPLHANLTHPTSSETDDLSYNNVTQIEVNTNIVEFSKNKKEKSVMKAYMESTDPIISVNDRIIDDGWALKITTDLLPIRIDVNKMACTMKMKIEHCNTTATTLKKEDCKLVTIKGRRDHYIVSLPIKVTSLQTLTISTGSTSCGIPSKKMSIILIHTDIMVENDNKKHEDIEIKSDKMIMESDNSIIMIVLASAAVILMMISISTCVILTTRKQGFYSVEKTKIVKMSDCECTGRKSGPTDV